MQDYPLKRRSIRLRKTKVQFSQFARIKDKEHNCLFFFKKKTVLLAEWKGGQIG